MWWVLLLLGLLPIVYRLLRKPHKYWTRKGVKQGNPSFLLGEYWEFMSRKRSFTEMVLMIYNRFPNDRYSGFYDFFSPTLLIRDPDLIKQITIKDFEHFVDHKPFLTEGADPLWANNLFALTGKRWRDMRNTLSPTFTSSKMKLMFCLISKSGYQFAEYFLKQDQDLIEMEMKDTFTRFTNDVIANVAFGAECDSLKNQDNEFYLMGKKLTDFTGVWKTIKFIGYAFFPELFKNFGVRFFDAKVGDFFKTLVTSSIKHREKFHIVRPDMLNLLLEAKKTGLKYEDTKDKEAGFATVEESDMGKLRKTPLQITNQDIISQAMIFFFAGFETAALLLCFLSYELAVNPDIQQKVFDEIQVQNPSKEEVTYEAIMGMKYLDTVVSETLRKWPIVPGVDRICTMPYTIEPKLSGEKPLHLEKNATVFIPTIGLHWDPHFYPDPIKFDPERFNEENRQNIHPCTYLPFGSGPRNCIGSRFALLQTKVLFVFILTNFEIVPSGKTQIPLQLCKKSFNMSSENSFWLRLKRRCSTK